MPLDNWNGKTTCQNYKEIYYKTLAYAIVRAEDFHICHLQARDSEKSVM